MVDSVSDLQFPVWGLLPKQETGIVAFLNKYPEYDGRNIRIAIFDSGVDPGAPGLQHTSTGETKIVERYDCSGCGDVNTTTTVKVNDDGCVKGLTGRLLKIPKTWKNINDEYRIGVKNAFELYPPKLKERIENERKEKLWDVQHKVIIADATRDLQKFEATSTKKNNTTLSESETLLKEDLECKLEYLNNLDKKYSDLGPVYDCILFNDGEMWRACIDTSEEGDLENGILLGEYSKTHQYAPLTKTDQLNISINVHDDGNILEIVGLCSGHGTHVASIASAYFPDHPEKNGAAPGAQVISLTIGDGRLGSMETGTALVRAMIKVMELHKTNPIHVINMSYGEHANWSNSGRIGELMNEVVNKYGVVWVVSAGNHGPALCTIGTPPDISQTTLIGVGAYVSPEMMVAEYSLRQKMPGMAYTWTSRGPTIDGSLGVSVCAPGAAITSVPNFTLRNAQLLNGTSMSAPHVAGAVCLLLSGLVAKKLPYSPFNVKRSLENTAQYLDKVDLFAQGRGLLQVEKAFEHLVTYNGCIANHVRFAVTCGAHNSKGIHIRNGVLTQPLEFNVNIDPTFKDDDQITPEQKINFSIQCVFVCKASYVQCPTFLDLQNFGRSISVKVDPSNLEVGVHYTCIDAYDVACVDKGPLFTIPITIVQPKPLDCNDSLDLHWSNVSFQPNAIQRHFIQVPETATWAVLRMKCNEKGKQGRFVVHCMQIRPKQSCKAQEFQKMTQVTSQIDTFLGFQVVGGLILEVVIAKYWANLGEIEIDYSLMFHGIKPDTANVTMQAADGLQQVYLRCLRMDEISPVITLKSSVQVLKPTDAKISPLTKRDIIPIGRQIYELMLTYEFHISKSTEVVPNCPLLSEVLYESELESQLWMLFDSNKQLLSSGDAYASKYVVKLERGDYVVKLHVRHDKKELLEKFNDIPMLLNRKLSNSFTLDVYGSYMQAITQGKKMVSAVGSKGAIIPIYISPFLSDKSKIASITGQYFVGSITYAKDEFGKKVDTYPFKYIPVEATKKAASKPDKDKTKTEEYNEALRDLKTSYLGKLDVPELANSIYEELKASNPDHVLIHTALMQFLDALEVKRQLPIFGNITSDEQLLTTLNKVIAVADVIINSTEIDKLLAILAVKNDQRPDAAKIKSFTERQKNAFLDALSRKGISLCRMYLLDKNTATNEETLESVKNIWKDLLKLVDPNEVKTSSTSIVYFALWHATVHKHYGRVLKFLLKLFEEKPQKEIEEKIVEVCGILGWDHCVRHINKSIPIKYPTHYRPF